MRRIPVQVRVRTGMRTPVLPAVLGAVICVLLLPGVQLRADAASDGSGMELRSALLAATLRAVELESG